MCSGRVYIKEAYHAIFQNDFNKAIEAFKKAIHCEPTNALYHHKLSITHSRNGDIREAIAVAQKALELQPNNHTYSYHLQILQSKHLTIIASDKLKRGMLNKEILELLNQAKNLDPLNIEAYLLLGIYYGEKKLFNSAMNEFSHVLNIEPVNTKARVLMEYYLHLYQEGGKNE